MSSGFVAALREAFPTAPCPDKDAIILKNCTCEQCNYVREAFGSVVWDEISAELIKKLGTDLPLLSRAGFKYYLPAYLLHAYETADRSLLGIIDYIVYSLGPSAHRPEEFNEAQRKIIYRFLNWASVKLGNGEAGKYSETWKSA